MGIGKKMGDHVITLLRNKRLEERVKQLEKDVQDITFTLSELLIWKRNQAIKSLPKTQHPKPEDSI